MKILLVEDEPKLAEFLKIGLEENQHSVEVAFDGYVGNIKAKTNNYDVCIFDVNLPVLNGFEITRNLRQENINTPVLMLTAMGGISNKTLGFEAGADDYLTKPFEFQELILRLNALHKRNNSENNLSHSLKFADLELNTSKKVAIRNGEEISLSSREYTLLEFFMKNKEKVLSRADIAEKVWDIHFNTGTNTIDVYINFLRKKIDKNSNIKLIHTVVGMGYILKKIEK
ncbi:DNA-binding response regulator [Lacihabitans sp. LS3-19]|uniref:response regulator transcription factor n=1 Tax=Lacihabitans sp. LS3-19 TaxID=2487335 RepID=UPI0020CF64B8|nr:response regulator transcription factor [Lacihabitans sp. LS3-19]MCP9767065.1 DNA-binding response regulator [Lacihabitans sp. LS3-19]